MCSYHVTNQYINSVLQFICFFLAVASENYLYITKHTITNLYRLLVAAENANDANTAAHSEKYVFKIARC